jgi:hypothetical protein
VPAVFGPQRLGVETGPSLLTVLAEVHARATGSGGESRGPSSGERVAPSPIGRPTCTQWLRSYVTEDKIPTNDLVVVGIFSTTPGSVRKRQLCNWGNPRCAVGGRMSHTVLP